MNKNTHTICACLTKLPLVMKLLKFNKVSVSLFVFHYLVIDKEINLTLQDALQAL